MPNGAQRSALSDLVEPLVSMGDGIDAAIRDSGRSLFDAGAVTLDHVGDLSVTARVEDDDGIHKVALGSTSGGLASSCECDRGATGLICAHGLATALETRRQASDRRERAQ